MSAPRAIQSLAYWVRRRPRLARLVLAMIPDVRREVHIEGVGRVSARLRTNRSLWLREPAATERVPWAMLQALIQPNHVVFDCGANLGIYCRFIAGNLTQGEVVAFEPDSTNLVYLRGNLVLGGIESRVRVVAVAVGDEDGECEFQIDDIQSTSGTLAKVSGGEPSEGRQNLALPPLISRVPVRRLDSLLSDGLPEPDVVKIDVEGAEAMVLRGAAELLAGRGPELVVELHGAAVGREVVTILREAGYHLFAEVSAAVDSSRWSRLGEEAVERIRGRYDLRFLAASRSLARIARVEEALRT